MTSYAGNFQDNQSDELPPIAIPDFSETKNVVINQGFDINQRAVSYPVAGTSNGTFVFDRWYISNNGGGGPTFQITQESTGGYLSGVFARCMRVQTTGTGSGTTTYNTIEQKVEVIYSSRLRLGQTEGTKMILMFWYRTNKAGEHAVSIQNKANTISYIFAFTPPVLDVWQQYSFIIDPPTGGNWTATDYNLVIRFPLYIGTSNRLGTPNAWNYGTPYAVGPSTVSLTTVGDYFETTGVYLAAYENSLDAVREIRTIVKELELCRRYCQAQASYYLGPARSVQLTYDSQYMNVPLMRAYPVSLYTGTFTVSAGLPGTCALIASSSTSDVAFQNTAGNWTVGANVAVTFVITSEF